MWQLKGADFFALNSCGGRTVSLRASMAVNGSGEGRQGFGKTYFGLSFIDGNTPVSYFCWGSLYKGLW